MNKVITINLHGNAYQLEEAGYEALRAYLEGAARKLEGNPDKDEIIADIEQAIADKCRTFLNAYRTVVSAQDVAKIVAEMGPVDAGASSAEEKQPDSPPLFSGGQPAGDAAGTARPARRLYRINAGAMLGGVCNGLAAHFNIDVTLVRLAFAVLAIVTAGGWVLAYLLMMLIVPTADTATAKAAAYGESNTAQDFIRRAREGYYEGMKAWGDRHARREWKRRFKRDMRGWRHAFRYEMHENMSQWQANWQRYWSEHPRFHFGLALALPFLSLCRAAITFVWIFAVISLLTTGAVFGILPPAGMPWWVALIVLLVVFNLIVWPFRVLRRSYYFHGLYGPCGSMAFFGLWDTFVWLGFVALLIWLADRYVPQAHHALRNLPAALHHAGESIRQWWSQN